MRRILVVAAAAGAIFVLAILLHVVLKVAADGSGSTADMAQKTCAGCHRT